MKKRNNNRRQGKGKEDKAREKGINRSAFETNEVDEMERKGKITQRKG